MLPEIGASELLIIAVVALIVVGPKDLPLLLRRLGQFMAKIRGMASEFRASFDEMARQSELDDLRKEVEAMRRGQLGDMTIRDGAMADTAADIEASLSDVGVQLHPPMSYQFSEPAPSEPPEPFVSPAPEPAAEADPKPARKPRAKRTASTDKAPAKGPPRARSKKIAE